MTGSKRADLGAILDHAALRSNSPHERSYLAFHRRRYELTLAIVQRLAQERSLRVLDVGAYPPYMFEALKELGHRVYAVASPAEPVEAADAVILDLETEDLPWPDNEFDLVLFCEVLEHLPHSPVPPLRQFLRVLRPGGRLVLTTPNLAVARHRLRLLLGESVMYPLDVYFESGERGRPLQHRHNREYTASELTHLLSRTGWRVDEVRDFMAYGAAYRQRARASGDAIARLRSTAAMGLHHAMPGAKDSLLAIASKPSTTR